MTVEAAGFCTHLPNMPTRKSGFVAWQQCNQEFKTKTEVAFSHRQPQVLWSAGDTVANCMALESEGVFNNRLNCLDVHGLTGPFRLSFLRLPADHGSLNIAWAVDDHLGRPLVSPILFDGNNFMNVKLNYFTGLHDGYWHPTDASAEMCESKHSMCLAVDGHEASTLRRCVKTHLHWVCNEKWNTNYSLTELDSESKINSRPSSFTRWAQ